MLTTRALARVYMQVKEEILTADESGLGKITYLETKKTRNFNNTVGNGNNVSVLKDVLENKKERT